MAHTITVAVERFPWHPRVRKQLRRTTRFLVHDARREVQVGDRVLIEETRPLSRRKHFRLMRVERPFDRGLRVERRGVGPETTSAQPAAGRKT